MQAWQPEFRVQPPEATPHVHHPLTPHMHPGTWPHTSWMHRLRSLLLCENCFPVPFAYWFCLAFLGGWRCRVGKTKGSKDARTSDTWTARARLKWVFQPEPSQEMWGMMSQRRTSQPGSFPNLWLLNHKQNKRVVLTHFQLICYTQHHIIRCDLKCLSKSTMCLTRGPCNSTTTLLWEGIKQYLGNRKTRAPG